MEEQQPVVAAGGGSIQDSDHFRWVISALETGLRSLVFATLVGCALVLVISKQEKPQKAPLRQYVAGYLSGCFAYFALSTFRVCFVGGYPLVGRPGKAVKCFRIILACFFISWAVAGCVWVPSARSICTDTPLLYWTSVVLVFSSGANAGLILMTITWKAEMVMETFYLGYKCKCSRVLTYRNNKEAKKQEHTYVMVSAWPGQNMFQLCSITASVSEDIIYHQPNSYCEYLVICSFLFQP